MHRLERVIRDLVAHKDWEKVQSIIEQLCVEYAYAVNQPHARNGGLIGLAAAGIALGTVRLPRSPFTATLPLDVCLLTGIIIVVW